MTDEKNAEAQGGGGPAEASRAEHAELTEWRYRAATGAALVSGAFSVFVAGLLLTSHFRGREGDLIDPPDALARAKRTLVKPTTSPEEKALKAELTERIRALDLELRRDHHRRTAFKTVAGYLLVGGIVVLVAALQLAAAFREKLPRPEGESIPGEELRAAGRARWAVGALGVVLVVGAVVLVASLRGDERGPAGPAVGAPPATGAPDGDGPGDGAPASAAAGSYPSREEIAKMWPRFRGPEGAGVSAYTDIPSTWSGETGENIVWKTPVPLNGASSPIVWGRHVFLTGADKTSRAVYCFDAETGKLIWTHDCAGVGGSPEQAPKVYSKKTGYAAPTPVTDGRRVYAVFANGDILAIDYQGKRVWARSLGLPRSDWGLTASLAMWRALVILQFDQSDEDGDYSSMLAFDAATGKTVWEIERDVPGSWSSPIVIKIGENERLITTADPWLAAYDPATGKELWRADLLGGYVAPSPIYAGGMVFAVMSDTGLAAVRPGGKGDVTATHVAWTDDEADLPDTSTPVSDGKLLFTASSGGYVTCFDAVNGVALWEKEVPFETYVSPSLVGDRLFVMGDNGVANVIAASRKLRTLAESKLGGKVHVEASPAFAQGNGKGRMFVRTGKHLYCIGKK